MLTRGTKRRFLCPTVLGLALVWAAYMIPAAFVIVVDPYDLYPWGVRIKPVSRHDILHANRLIGIAASDREADTLLVGSSVSMRIQLEDLREQYPDTRIAWNLSYPGVTGRDRQIVLDRIAEHSRARHVLVMLDYMLGSPVDRVSRGFPTESYDDDPTNDLRVVDSRTLREARSALLRGTPFPNVEASDRALRRFLAGRRSSTFYRPTIVASITRSLREQRATIDVDHDMPCSALPLLRRFEATMRRLAAQGRRVDLIAPVYSPSFYYQYRVGGQMDDSTRMNLLGRQLAMRRCVVKALGATPNIVISALDRDTALVNDLTNFYDSGHIVGRTNFRRQLLATNDPRYRLTPANIDAYLEAYRRNVKTYCPTGFPKSC